MPPLFKCYPPHQFNQLKTVILQNYNTIRHSVPQPRFVTLAFPSLQKVLVRAKITPTIEQLFDILQKIESLPQNTTHTTSGELPILKCTGQLQISPCNNPRCSTCTHLNCSSFFHQHSNKTTISNTIFSHVHLIKPDLSDHVHQV